MKVTKILNIALFSLVIVTMISVGAYAQDQGREIDVTMDIVRQSDVRDLTESVMNRIHLPDAARKGERMGDEMIGQHQMHDDGDAQHMMHDDVGSVKEDTMQMRENVHHMRDGTRQMGNDADDMRDHGMGDGMMD